MSQKNIFWDETLFFDVAIPHFRYLIDEFGYRKPLKTSRSLFYSLRYKGDQAAIIITLDRREQHIFVDIIRLVDHEIPPRYVSLGGKVTDDTQNYFNLDQLLLKFHPELLKETEQRERKLSSADITRIIVNSAALLRAYGMRVVNGDFSEFASDRR